MKPLNVRMAANGRLVLPASIRAETGMLEGGDFLVLTENGLIILEPHKKALQRLRAFVQQQAPAEPGTEVVEELIAERHAEAARE